MTSIVIQPRGSAQEHYANTVAQPVQFSQYASLIADEALAELNILYPRRPSGDVGVLRPAQVATSSSTARSA